MKKPWTSDEPVYRGKTIAVLGVRFYPKPVQKQHPPIEITARAGDTRIRGK
jgi:alkanesulfonate monooxygenase SsuD/methylene tetrahydromethanopterin reductase-like flavin-dependent oxidoreductase (luciferase family)